jgi:DNA-binding transcriptional MerR regulator
MGHREKLPRRIYFQIKDACELTDRNASAIRYWLDQFNIGTVKRIKGGKRTFSESDLQKVLAIKYLLDVEYYTMKGAQIKYNLWERGEYKIPEDYIKVPEDFIFKAEDDFVLEYD